MTCSLEAGPKETTMEREMLPGGTAMASPNGGKATPPEGTAMASPDGGKATPGFTAPPHQGTLGGKA